MDMVLFKKIIDQISRWDKVRIIPYFNNEPFLDIAFFEKMEYIASKCPNAEIEISTNMSMLDAARQAKLSRFKLTELRMSVFGFSDYGHKKIMRGLDWKKVKNNLDYLASNFDLRSNIETLSLVMIDYPGIDKSDIESAKKYCSDNGIKFEFWGFLDRAGSVRGLSNNFYREIVHGCEQRRPFERMHITFDGKVVLCCMDWFRQHILGEADKQTLDEIWRSDRYIKIRELISSGTNRCPEICKRCKISI